jgi:quinol monooxygenase YgiN
MIHVLAQVETTPGHRDEFFAEFAKVAPLVRQESGCIEYGAAIDMPTDIPVQNFLGDNAVLIIEKWESVEHLQAHLVAPHMSEYRIRVRPYVQGVTLRVLEPKV